MPATPTIYGRRLRQARKAARWTQPELGRQLGWEDAAAAVRISRYENGQHMPDGPTADALARALRLPQAWFFAETDTIAEAILILSKLPKVRQEELLVALKAATGR